MKKFLLIEKVRRFIIQIKYTPLKKVLVTFLTLLSCNLVKLSAQSNQRSGDKKILRCATMQNLDVWRKKMGKAANDITAADAAKYITATTSAGVKSNTQTYKETGTEATVYVPVVVHIVLPNATLVTDADVATQIQILNTDFAGLNADSTGIPAAFKPFFGKSNIQFVLAKRDPDGNLTSGIERRNNDVSFDPNSYPDPIKYQASGGLSSWDATKYYNVWVGNNSDGILGYAPFPGTETNADQGATINILGFGTNSCYTFPGYDLGRTLVHETGHYFGLFHIWGDEDGCTGDDFQQLGGTLQLPTGLYNPSGQGNTSSDIGDTPNMGASTSGCPSGVVTDACSTTAPGRMYQDFMDYTDDACYKMFTSKQVERMEWVINNGRTSLLTSDRGTLPSSLSALDAAATAFINPGGSETVNCTSRSYVLEQQCPQALQPSCIITNAGTTTLTSVKAELRINGQSITTLTATVNLKTAESTTITFPSFTPVTGNNVLQVIVSNPNNGTDQNKLNDTAQTVLKVSQSAALPLTEGFEGSTFPPANWIISQTPTDDITWQRTTRAAKTGTASAYMNNFNYEANGRIDELISPQMSFANVDSVFIKFDVAAATVSPPATTTIPIDTLAVFVSTDCGTTYQQVYKKWGSSLVTVSSSVTTEFFPSSTQWRTDSVNITSVAGTSGNIIVKFRNTENFENNVFLDNINIYTRTLPALLKKNGILIYPNPTSGQIIVQHLQLPENLRGINVYSATGQLVYQKQFTSTTVSSYIPLNLTALSSGVYMLRLVYTDKQTTQKIIKTN